MGAWCVNSKTYKLCVSGDKWINMVSKTKVTGIGGLISQSPTRASSEKRHPDRLNLILYRESEMNRYKDWFGDDSSEENVYCDFFGIKPTDSTTVKRDRLFSFIHMVSTGKLQVIVTPEETPEE